MMLKLLMNKKSELEKLQQVLDYLHSIDPRKPVVVEKKKNYTWLIVLGCFLGIAVVGFVVYKMFFEISDDFEDFDDDDFDDIDYDEDYDEAFEDYEEVAEEEE